MHISRYSSNMISCTERLPCNCLCHFCRFFPFSIEKRRATTGSRTSHFPNDFMLFLRTSNAGRRSFPFLSHHQIYFHVSCHRYVFVVHSFISSCCPAPATSFFSVSNRIFLPRSLCFPNDFPFHSLNGFYLCCSQSLRILHIYMV